MATGNQKINLFLKKFLPQQQFKDNFLEYLLAQTRQNLELQYPDSGVFEGGVLSSLTSDQFRVSIPTTATDGQGRILELDPAHSFVPFQNEIGVDYYVGLRFNKIFQETEVNPRTGKIEYTFIEEQIGELAEPTSVADNGTSLTFNLDSVFEAGVSHAGRTVLAYLKQAQGEADAFFIGVSSWNGSNNVMTTSNLLGQTAGSVSTDAADYQVFVFGPTVRRNTDLSLDPNITFLGIVTGAGAGNQPTDFDQDGINQLFPTGEVGDLNDEVKSFLVGGGLISWDLDSQTLTWAEPLKMVLPHRPHNFDVAAGSVAGLADGEILYIEGELPGGTKPLLKVAANSMPNLASNIPIAVREGNNVYFRDGALELKGAGGEDTSGRIHDITQDLLNYLGADSETDGDPNYTSVPLYTPSTVAQGDNLTLAIDKLNAALSAFLTNNPRQEEFVVGPGGQSTFNLSTITFEANNAKFDIEVFMDGRRLVQDPAGGTGRDFRKTAIDQLETSFLVPEGRTITVWKQGFVMGGLFPPTPGQLWSDPVDASIIPNSDIAHDLGSSIRRVRQGHVQDLFVNNPKIVTALGQHAQIKTMLSGHSATILAGTPVAKAADGFLYPAESDVSNGKKYVGITLEAIGVGGSGQVFLCGWNLPGVVTGLGFAPGDDIYVGEAPGTYTNDPSAFTGLDDDIVRIGIADTADNTSGGAATDIIMLSDVAARA